MENLALNRMALAIANFNDFFDRNADFLNQALEAFVVLDGFLQIGLDLVFVALVGMHDIPLSRFSLF